MREVASNGPWAEKTRDRRTHGTAKRSWYYELPRLFIVATR